MASPGGTSSGSSSMLPNSTSEEDLQLAMDQRKRKRMLSNRESARRSRMRKQKHLDDLMNQVAQLRKENNQILTTYKVTTQQYLAVEAENSVLRTQILELNTRLHSLNEIVNYMNGIGNEYAAAAAAAYDPPQPVDTFMNPWNITSANQPIVASADMMFY